MFFHGLRLALISIDSGRLTLRSDILKLDIEYAEFEVLESLGGREVTTESESSVSPIPIGQILVEIHLFNDIKAEGFLAWWECLEARGLRPAWTEPNLLAVTLNNDGKKNPNMAEYTLLNVHDDKNVIFR